MSRCSGLLYHLNAAKSQEKWGAGGGLVAVLSMSHSRQFSIMLIQFCMYCSPKLTEVEMGVSHG